MCKAVEEIAAKVGKVLTQYRLTWKNLENQLLFSFHFTIVHNFVSGCHIKFE